MTKKLPILALVFLFFGCDTQNAAPEIIPAECETCESVVLPPCTSNCKTVALTLIIPAQDAGFRDAFLEVQLFRYEPYLADTPADRADRVVLEKLRHDEGAETRYEAQLSAEHVEGLRFYVTAGLYLDASLSHSSRLYFADGFNAVLETKEDEAKVIVLTRLQ